MIDGLSLSGALPRTAGNPSPRGTEGGRLFRQQLAGALRKHLENPSLQGAQGGVRHLQVEQKINEYAGFFVEQMMQSMRKNVMESGLADGGRAEQVFQGMLDQGISEKLAAGFRFQKSFGKALQRVDREAQAPLKESSIHA